MDDDTELLEEVIVAKVSAKMEVKLQEMQEKLIALFQDFLQEVSIVKRRLNLKIPP